MRSLTLAALLVLGARAQKLNGPSRCPPLHRGSFNIHQYQLYPENADWDEASCLVYFG